MMARTYIYGIIPTSQSSAFGPSGFPPRPEEVRTVACRGLGCVVSNYSGEDFASLPKETLLRCLMAHQEVVERVMQAFPVLPVKFGTLVEDESAVHRLMQHGQRTFAETLAQMDGKAEMEVAATWDLKRVLQEVGQADEILRLKASLPSKAPAEALELQMQAGKIVKESLDRRREECQQRLLGSLRGAALDVQPNALVADEMVLNMAFLIEKEFEGEFDEQVRKLDEALNGEVSFRIVGPLPPYSFATVEVVRPSAEKLEKARRLLGLDASVSRAEVKAAFRRLAAQTHPDARGENGQGDEGFVRVREAYDLLTAYCRGQEDGDSERTGERRVSLAPEDVSQAFLVSIRRADTSA